MKLVRHNKEEAQQLDDLLMSLKIGYTKTTSSTCYTFYTESYHDEKLKSALSSERVTAPELGVPYEDAFTEAVRFLEKIHIYIFSEADVGARIIFRNYLTKKVSVWSEDMNLYDAVIKFITDNVGKTTNITYRSIDDEYHQLVFFNTHPHLNVQDCYTLSVKKVYS